MGIIQRIAAVSAAAAIVGAAACGGSSDERSDDDSSSTSGTEVPDESSTAVDDSSNDGDALLPLDGPMVTVLDFGLGVYGIDRTTGDSVAFTLGDDDPDDPWFAVRDTHPVSDGQAGFSVVQRDVADLEFVAEFALGRFDIGTGRVALVAEFGPERESSESTDRTSWEIVGTGGGVVWIEREASTGGELTRTFLAVDGVTGEVDSEVGSIFDVESETTTCTVDALPLGVDAGGDLIVIANGLPATVGSTGDLVSDRSPCGDEPLELGELIGSADPADFTVLDEATTLPPDEIERMYSFEPRIQNRAAIVTDSVIAWVFATTRSIARDDGQITAIIGGLATLDRETGDVTVLPLGDQIGQVLETDGSSSTVTTLSQVGLHEAGGFLWLIDEREEGLLSRIDVAAGTVETFEVPIDPVGVDPDPDAGDGPRGTEGAGSRYTKATMIGNDADGVWLSVGRFTINEEGDDGSRSASGPSYIDQVDVTTGDVIRSIPESELTGLDF